MPAVWLHFLLLFGDKTWNIQASRTTDALLIMSVLSCKTSLYWEYKCNMEHKWTKRIIINNDWNFHSHGRAWMNLFSARTSPLTSTKTTTKPHCSRLLSWTSFHFFPIPCILTTAFINTYLDHFIWPKAGK